MTDMENDRLNAPAMEELFLQYLAELFVHPEIISARVLFGS